MKITNSEIKKGVMDARGYQATQHSTPTPTAEPRTPFDITMTHKRDYVLLSRGEVTYAKRS